MMEDFYQQFKNNLDNQPEPEYDKRMWDKLAKEMDRQERPPRSLLPWWVAAAAVLLLLGSNGWWFWQSQQTSTPITRTELRVDTIIQQQIVQRTDTLIQTRTVYQTLSATPTLANSSRWNSSFPTAADKTIQSFYAINQDAFADSNNGRTPLAVAPPVFNNPLAAYQYRQRQQASVAAAASNADDTNILMYLDRKNIAELTIPSTIPLPPIELPEFARGKKSWLRPLARLQPTGLQVSLNGGSSRLFSEGLQSKMGVVAGLTAGIVFSPQLQMWIDATYDNTPFATTRMGEDIGVPVVEAPTDDVVFHKAEVSQPSFQYSAGMQYLFNRRNKWRPFLGAGYAVVQTLPYEVLYDFENEDTDVEIQIEREVNRRDLLNDFLLLRSGLEYHWNDHWNTRLQVDYRMAWDADSFRSAGLVHAQLGIGYLF